MKATPRKDDLQDDMQPEYNFDYSKAVRGKYLGRLVTEGSNVVVLEPDVAKAFGDSAAVNQALRTLLEFARATQDLTKRRSGPRNSPKVPSE